MAKSKSRSKKGGTNNNSSAKNIKALIAQNKMTENQNAEMKKEAEEKRLAREAEKEAKLAREAEAKEAAEAASEAKVLEGQEENLEAVSADEVIVDETVSESPKEKDADKKSKKDDKNSKSKKKDKKEKRGLGKKVKDTASELKKVTWPSFKEVVKKTGVVFAVVIFFGVVLLAFDFLMSLPYEFFIS